MGKLASSASRANNINVPNTQTEEQTTRIQNQEPISLLSNLYKLFSKVKTGRLTRILDESQPNEQAGFRRGFSTADHLQSVNQITKKSREFALAFYLAFVDYNTAIGSVEHPAVLQAMNKQGIRQKFIRIFEKLYSKSTVKVKTERTGPSFKLGSGVIYDDIVLFSPDPKNLQEILLKLDDHSKSVRLSINRNKTKIMSNWR